MTIRRRAAFVTGAAGFIGRHLVERLVKDGWQVTALVRREGQEIAGAGVTTVVGDVLDIEALRKASTGADVFFHLAGQASVAEANRAPEETFQVNVTGTSNAVEACRLNGISRLVCLSTMHVFGPSPADAEIGRFNPQSGYAASKLEAEQVALEKGRQAGVEVVVLRPSNIYGPRQTTDAVVPGFVMRVLEGEILAPHSPQVTRRFLYVDDLTDAIVRAAVTPEAAGQAINLEAADSTTIGELAELIQRMTASDGKDAAERRPISDDAAAHPNPLGWSATVPLHEGIARTVEAARRAAPRPSAEAGGIGPKVSIVIPVYNGSVYMADAIDSALAQSYANIEVIVVNDGSNDGGATAAVAARYGDRIRYVEKANGGVSTALNAGIEAMQGELFSWLSHDDLYHPDKVADEVCAYVAAGRPHLVFCDCEHISETGEWLGDTALAPLHLDEKPLNGLFGGQFNGCTFLIPRQTLVELGGFDPGLPTTQDYSLWFEIARKLPFLHVPRVLVTQRLHPDQGSRTPAHLREADRLMAYMIDQTSPEEMIAYDGSVARFLIRIARRLLPSIYAGGGSYAAFRARQELLRLPHTVLLIVPSGALGEALAEISRQSTQFEQRSWLLLSPDEPDEGTETSGISFIRTDHDVSPAEALALDWPAGPEFIFVGFRPPADEDVLSVFNELVFTDGAVAELPAGPLDATVQLRGLRRSRKEEAARKVAADGEGFHRPASDPSQPDRGSAYGQPSLPAASLAALGNPIPHALLAIGFTLLEHHSTRRIGARLIRNVLRRAGLAHVVDEPWYRATYGLRGGSNLKVWVDYLTRGWSSGREPSPWFHGNFYVQQTTDWNGTEAPLRHFLTRGAVRGLLPHPKFARGSASSSAYVPPDPRPQAHSTLFRQMGAQRAAAMLSSGFKPELPTVLICLHCWGGGTLTHARELGLSLARFANVLFVFGGGKRPFILSDRATHPPEGVAFDSRAELSELAALLDSIGIDHVDIHHSIDFEAELEDLIARLAVPYDVTLVDYHLIARQPHLSGPDGKFVGDGAAAAELLRDTPLRLYVNAARRIAISRDMALRLRTLRPEFDVVCAANWTKPPLEQRTVRVPRIWHDEPLRVLVFGPMADHKGWDSLVKAAECVLARKLPIEFHVLGASEMSKPLPPSAALINHGWFAADNLSERIGSIAPHVAWYPAQAPESWCYALGDAMTAQLPIVANAIGALIERCHGRRATWMLPPDTSADQVVDLMDELRRKAFDVESRSWPANHLPAAENFYFDAYLAPARDRTKRRRRGN